MRPGRREGQEEHACAFCVAACGRNLRSERNAASPLSVFAHSLDPDGGPGLSLYRSLCLFLVAACCLCAPTLSITMVKKAKGKHRLDKFYYLAKEQG